MIRMLACMAIAAAALPANAQVQPPKAVALDAKAMYEDIEILRRILARELTSRPLHAYSDWLSQYHYNRYDNIPTALSSYANATNLHLRGDLYWSAKRSSPATLEGAYLKGHGVSYTLGIGGIDQAVYDPATKGMGLISICIKCHAAATAERALTPGVPNRAPPKLSDWEKMRREVKGEKEEPQPSVAEAFKIQGICSPGNLTEKILKVLAENGHHFQQLPGSENISVVVTFPNPRGETTDSQRRSLAVPLALRAAEEAAANGDLHFKQQKYAEAIQSYSDAVKHLETPLSFAADTNYEAARQSVEGAQRLLRSSYTKLAQAFLASGKTAEAKDALTKAETASLKVNLPKEKLELKVSPNLPAKLVITVSKKAIEQHHDGKLSLEQFRKEAEVQAINLPPAERKTP